MKNRMLLKVFVSILLAVVVGWYVGTDKSLFGVTYVRIFGLIGQLFLNALMLVVIPLVSASIITGTARIGSDKSFGALGAKTFGAFFGVNALAVATGLLFSLLFFQELPTQTTASTTPLPELTLSSQQLDGFDKITQVLLKIIPSNILAVASQGQILGLIAFCLLFGYFMSKIEERPSSILMGFWQGVFQIMLAITHLVMRALPIGVFALVAKVVATTGFETFQSVAKYTWVVILGLLAFALIILPLLLLFIAKVNPILHFRAVMPALVTAFSTSSSVASLPVTIESVEQRVGVSNRICSFTIPLGTSFSMSGSALFQTISILFIVLSYGMELSFSTLTLITLMSLLTATGMAGVPSASLISIVLILNTVGIPAEAIGLILAVERILDMCRTTVNVLGNTCCSVLVARSEGEHNLLRVQHA